MQYSLGEDIELVRELLGVDSRTLSNQLGISRMTLNRWSKQPGQASAAKIEAFYSYAFAQGIRLNDIHAQLFAEECCARALIPLFHGSKQGIEGRLSLEVSRADNDFGKGFYCGENLQQAAMFVANHPRAVCYSAAFDPSGLVGQDFSVERSWMLAIALFRGRLDDYRGHDVLREVERKVQAADYVVAPIADNRMFQIIDSFIDGEITDVQCEHSLSATNLGMQYVIKSQAALERLVGLQPYYLCEAERAFYLDRQRERAKTGTDKSKAARRQYRGQGHYIEELFS